MQGEADAGVVVSDILGVGLPQKSLGDGLKGGQRQKMPCRVWRKPSELKRNRRGLLARRTTAFSMTALPSPKLPRPLRHAAPVHIPSKIRSSVFFLNKFMWTQKFVLDLYTVGPHAFPSPIVDDPSTVIDKPYTTIAPVSPGYARGPRERPDRCEWPGQGAPSGSASDGPACNVSGGRRRGGLHSLNVCKSYRPSALDAPPDGSC